MKNKLKKVGIIFIASIVALVSIYYFFIFIIVGYNPFAMGKPRSKQEIMSYCYANHMQNEEIYFIDSSALKARGKGNFPKMFLFDEEGHELKFHNCFELVDGFLDTLADHPNYFTLDTQSTLAQEFSHFRNVDEHAVDTTLTNKKYYLVYYYAMWSDRLNQKKLFKLRDKLALHDEIQFFAVNCDVRKEWHLRR
jgi:hypothetical protein